MVYCWVKISIPNVEGPKNSDCLLIFWLCCIHLTHLNLSFLSLRSHVLCGSYVLHGIPHESSKKLLITNLLQKAFGFLSLNLLYVTWDSFMTIPL